MSKLEDTLQSCLDEMKNQGLSADACLNRHPEVIPALAPLLRTAERYRRAPTVGPPPAFRQVARTRLLNMMAMSQSPAKNIAKVPRRAFSWYSLGPLGALVRVGLALVVLLALLGGTGIAAQAASPDSPMYPVKLALEEARLALALNDQQRAEVQLAIAERRAQELTQMAEKGNPDKVKQAANRYEAAVQAAVRHATRPDALPAVTLPTEAALAAQQKHLQEAIAQMEGAGPEARASLGKALGLLERERTELRTKLGKDDSKPSGGPSNPPEQKRQQQEGLAATATPEPTATPGGITPTLTPTVTNSPGNHGKYGRPDQPGQGVPKEGL